MNPHMFAGVSREDNEKCSKMVAGNHVCLCSSLSRVNYSRVV